MNQTIVITPSTGRSWCFGQLRKYMKDQQFACRWIVVGEDHKDYDFSPIEGVELEHHTRKPKKNETLPSICLNWQLALKKVGELGEARIICMEDDDFYSPAYLRQVWIMLNSTPLAGFNMDLYFNVRSRRWGRMGNVSHCSLACTGFKADVLPLFETIINEPSQFIDLALWDRWDGKKKTTEMNRDNPEHIGLKGCPGTAGCGSYHDDLILPMFDDGTRMRKLMGDYAKDYTQCKA